MKYLALFCLIFGIAVHMTFAAPAPGMYFNLIDGSVFLFS